MKVNFIKSIADYSEFANNRKNLGINKNQLSHLSFKGKPPSPAPFIDKFLNAKATQKLAQLASSNPFAFTLAVGAAIAVIRPLTILAVPGSNKEDKKYAAAKTVIASVMIITTKLALALPLANQIKKLAIKAKNSSIPTKFPPIDTPRFHAYNYLINNGFSFIVSTIMASFIVDALAKVMNKILPSKNESPQLNLKNAIDMHTPFTFNGGINISEVKPNEN